MMKTVNYFGQSVTVPDYAKYIATDTDGEVWWYIDKPIISDGWWCTRRAQVNGRAGNNPNIKNWRRSLREC